LTSDQYPISSNLSPGFPAMVIPPAIIHVAKPSSGADRPVSARRLARHPKLRRSGLRPTGDR
ncbi:MAG TPA: hypothetical protein VN894_14320, partial [Polyangiaceae bacterium]|nr:hypothetical protein [Polyangiaceae bacterium]